MSFYKDSDLSRTINDQSIIDNSMKSSDNLETKKNILPTITEDIVKIEEDITEKRNSLVNMLEGGDNYIIGATITPKTNGPIFTEKLEKTFHTTESHKKTLIKTEGNIEEKKMKISK